MIALLAAAGAMGADPAAEIDVVGYLDVGFFAAQGIAYVPAEHVLVDGDRPAWVPSEEQVDAAWVFTGDPWANAVNSQGESADLGSDGRNRLDRPDRMAAADRPTFVVNALAPGLLVHRGAVAARSELLIEPGDAPLGALGDRVSVDVAYVEWTPLDADLHVSVGKVESAFGYEYRHRRAPERHGITPSIVARYTTGTPVGVKARGSLAHGHVPFALGVTNGGTFTERFGHFADDVDANGAPTLTARLGGYTERPFRLQGGVSGQAGVQDGQPDRGLVGYQLGADARFDTSALSIRGEIVRSFQPGSTITGADRLDALGGYVQVHGWVTPWFAPLVRYDERRALLDTHDNLYLTHVSRVTVGARFDVSAFVALKAEALHVIERLGPPIEDDVFTTSLVYRF